jgi:hypothetical protein
VRANPAFLVFCVCAVLLLIVALALYLFARRCGTTDKDRNSADWRGRVCEVASNHTQVTGVLAGFTITIVVLLVGFRFENTALVSGAFLEEAALGMFMMSFFGFVVTGILYSIVSERENTLQYFLFSIASVMYYFSVVLSFTALLPLARLMNYEFLKLMIVFIVTGAILGGYWAVAIPLYDLLRLRRRFLALLLLLAIALAATLLALGAFLVDMSKPGAVFFMLLPLCSVLVSVIFSVCMLTFFVRRIVHEKVLSALSLTVIFAITATVIYLASLTVAFLVA